MPPISVEFNDSEKRHATAPANQERRIHDCKGTLLAHLKGESEGGRVSFIERDQVNGNHTVPEVRVEKGKTITHEYQGVTATITGE
jgi:hypothetical protein